VTDDTTKQFFAYLVEHQALAKVVGFENEAFIFPGVHHSFKFCALTITGENIKSGRTDFVFFCREFADSGDVRKHFELSSAELALINPNTRTCPIFRARYDAEVTKKIYRRVPILLSENNSENPWHIEFLSMFHMSNDSYLFKSAPAPGLLPLYEAKMIHQFDHRFGTFEGATQAQLNLGSLPQPDSQKKSDPTFTVMPRYWVAEEEASKRWGSWNRYWAIGFRDITSSVVERTSIFSLLPRVAMGNSLPLMLPTTVDAKLVTLLLANLNSLTLDYVARQKIAGTHMNFFFLQQLPILSPQQYSHFDLDYIFPRVLELIFNSYDSRHFASDVGYKDEPFTWDDIRRECARAELDGYYAHLYGLTRDELCYILDPKDVFGEDFPSETFRVLREREQKEYGEYRTRRLVLEAFDKLAESPRFRDEMPKRRSVFEVSGTSDLARTRQN
jgi:hypothetical protein